MLEKPGAYKSITPKERFFVKLKKVLSVFLAFVMLFGVFSIGFSGVAAGINYAGQYEALANALKNEHVRELTNYEIQNITLNNGTEGFVAEANGFAFEHRVVATDNAHGDILRAANRFYYIAENLMQTTYGVGCYNADTLIKEIIEKVKPYFNDSDEAYYEDFYGARYYPTAEELAKYNEAVTMIEATGRQVSQASLTAYNIYFMEKDYYSYFNIETILRYFMGDTLKINAGNWYHRYTFVVETSVDTCLKESEGLNNFPDNNLTKRTGIFEITYSRTMDETGTKAYYAFNAPSWEKVHDDYASEYNLPYYSKDLTGDEDSPTAGGQATNFFIAEEKDNTTIPYLAALYTDCLAYFNIATDCTSWDEEYAKLNEAQLAALPKAAEIVSRIEEITEKYSNDALMSVFGKDMGNMMTLAYILKPISQSPTRTVRTNYDGSVATYTATADKLNSIVRDMDALVYDDTTDTAQRVGTIVKQFFNTNNSLFEGTAVAGKDFTDLNELVHYLVTGLLFRDSIVNMLVELIYPLIADLIAEKVVGAVADAVGSGLGNIVDDLLTNIINQNDLAIYPDDLADRIARDYPGKFAEARAVLKAAGHSWDNVNYDAINWGIDNANDNEKAELFLDALCAGLGGFMRAVVTVMCGDAEYSENAGLSYDDDQFDTYYDKKLINILGITGWLRSQGGYSKLIVPLFRVLGIPEMANGAKYNTTISGYVTPADYHKIIASKDGNGNYRYNYSLRLILAPIVYWVENILAQRPFETIWNLIPNLVFFFTRQGSSVVSLSDISSHNQSETRDADSSHGGHFNSTNGKNEWEELGNYNLLTILNNVHILIDITVPILFNKNFTINIGSLAELIDKDAMLGSVNGLLNEVLSLEYVIGESGVLSTVAYANAEGIAVMPDSFEYATNPDAYPIELQYVYANENETEYRANPDDTHTKEITNPELLKAPYKIPALQEAKLTTVTTLDGSGKLVDPNAIGILNTDWNTIDVQNPGVVLMYVLRFVLSALGYRFDRTDAELPSLIECFGLNIDNELFQGLNLKDIIYNVMLHPDAAICALLELFYSNETGNYHEREAYTYKIKPIDYHENVLLNKTINPGLTYGSPVRYSQYWTREYANDTLNNIDELATNVLSIIEIDGVDLSDGIGNFLADLLNEKVFNNDLMNTLFNTIYQLLAGLNDTVGFDIEKVLDAALGIQYNTTIIGNTLEAMAGASPASETIKNASSWTELFTLYTETDPESGEAKPVLGDITLDWGINGAAKPHEAFLKTASALLAPAAFVFRFLFLDEHLDILGLIDLDGYAGYQYAFIGLLEMLSCPKESILSYDEYYNKAYTTVPDTLVGEANTIYYLLSPILGLLEKVYTDPITTALSLIPNLLFFISIGGLNDLVNNLVHFAYVLLDVLKPIVNGYDLLSGLLSNIDISGFILNLTLPLNIDFNALISELLDTLVGDSLTIEGVKISLPYIDFHTLCCGTLEDFSSRENRQTVYLNSAGGGDLLTAIFRLAFEILYMDENRQALSQILVNLISADKLDKFDGETLLEIVNLLFDLVEEYEVPDMLLYVVYFLVTKLTPISGTLKDKLQAKGMTINQLFEGDVGTILGNIVGLLEDGDDVSTDDSVPVEDIVTNVDMKEKGGFWKRLVDFFKMLGEFFRNLFGIK